MSISLFSGLLAYGLVPPPIVEPEPDVQLDEDWNNFEKTLDEYKSEYYMERQNFRKKETEYISLVNDVEILRATLKSVHDAKLCDDVHTCIEEYTKRVCLQEKKEELAFLSGKVKAMDDVLVNTNAKRHNQFTCPICMDRPVNIFLNPCGHLICDVCMIRLLDSKCPTCRADNVTKCRMYTSL